MYSRPTNATASTKISNAPAPLPRASRERPQNGHATPSASTSGSVTAIAIQYQLIVSDTRRPHADAVLTFQSLTSPLKIVNTSAMSSTATNDENRPAPSGMNGSPNIPTSHRNTNTPS